MRSFLGSTPFPAVLILALILGFTAREAWRTERSDAGRIRTMCERENITDVQIHECMIRLRMQGGPDKRLGQR